MRTVFALIPFFFFFFLPFFLFLLLFIFCKFRDAFTFRTELTFPSFVSFKQIIFPRFICVCMYTYIYVASSWVVVFERGENEKKKTPCFFLLQFLIKYNRTCCFAACSVLRFYEKGEKKKKEEISLEISSALKKDKRLSSFTKGVSIEG